MFEVGKIYNRKEDINSKYGGQQQGGISTPKRPYIFIFTGLSGQKYGYNDGWDKNGVFLYTGEGQIGDMRFIKGNKAIRDHSINGKELLLFESLGKGQGYRYRGLFGCGSWEYRKGKDLNGNLRRVIIFHLIKADEGQYQPIQRSEDNLDALRKSAYNSAAADNQGSAKEAKRKYYERSRAVKIYVMARASGVCECCGKPAPFKRKDGQPYLEPHHTRRLSDNGPDHPRWVAAVCPNCHTEIHHGKYGDRLNKKLGLHLNQLEGNKNS